MKLNERQRHMLRAIARGPRTAHSFTHGDAPCAPHVIQAYLDHMTEGGVIELTGRDYAITEAGQRVNAQEPEVVPSRLFCNASTKPGSYKPPAMGSFRPGADDHRLYLSRGV